MDGFVVPAFPVTKKTELEVLLEEIDEDVDNFTTSKKKASDMLFGPTQVIPRQK